MKTTLKTLGLTMLALSASIVSAHNGVDHTMSVSAATKFDADADVDAKIQPLDIPVRPINTSGSVGAEKAYGDPAPVKENIQRRTANRYEKMLNRFKMVIERENLIMAKINSRIAKIKAAGGNTTEAEKLTAAAKVELDAATAGLVTLTAQADAQANLETASTTVIKLREGLNMMRQTGSEIEKHLRAAHQDLLKCVGILRGNSQLKASATTTVNAE